MIGEILQTQDMPTFLETIFPKLRIEEKPPCGAFPVCTRERMCHRFLLDTACNPLLLVIMLPLSSPTKISIDTP